MKRPLKIFVIVFIIAFSSISCNRNTSTPTVTEVMQYESASVDQNEEVTPYPIVESRVTSFTPLQDNERLDFRTARERRNPATPHSWTPVITVYAVGDNDIEDISLLFSWDNVPWHHIRLSGDSRMCFFIKETTIAPDPVRRDLYVAVGSTGEIRRLLTDMRSANFHVSNDGKFVLHLRVLDRVFRSINLVNFYLIEVETGVILSEFEWYLDRDEITHEVDPIEAIGIFWNDGIFQLHALGYRDAINAEAEFDPETRELRTLFIR